MGILGAMLFMRLGLEPLVKALRKLFRASVPWERSSEFHILREVCFITLNPTCPPGYVLSSTAISRQGCKVNSAAMA